MKKDSKALVLGGTGAMGVYLVPELAAMDCRVRVVSLDDVGYDDPRISHLKANALDDNVLRELLKEQFDVIVDFLIYPTEAFRRRHELLLKNTGHYIFLSSYRVYGGGVPVTEETPRLLDVSQDKRFLASENYALIKARQEDILRQSEYGNWTIIRPSITYSKLRFQLVTLEASDTVGRAFTGKKVVLPIQAKDIQGTMSWGGDVARMISRLLSNPKARGETFTVATAEHHTWGEIADFYKSICNLEAVWIDEEDFLRIIQPNPLEPANRWQLEYDRLFTRVIDNSKVLAATGLTQESMMPLYRGLEKEIANCSREYPFRNNDRMDAYLDGKL